MSWCYPGLGFDPAPGDPDGLDATARTVGRTAAAMLGSAVQLRRLAAPDGVWEGEASGAYRAQVQSLPAELERAAAALRSVQNALARQSGELRVARHRALGLEQAASVAQRRLRDPEAVRALEDARARAQSLRRELQAAAEQTAASVRAAARAAPDGLSLWRRMAAAQVAYVREAEEWLGEQVVEHQAVLSTAADVAGVAATVAAFVPGGQGVSAGLGVLALGAHAAVAHYTDETWEAAGFAAVGVATGGLGQVAGRLALRARAAGGLPPTADEALPALFARDLAMGQTETLWRTAQLQADFAGAALTTASGPWKRPDPTPARAGRSPEPRRPAVPAAPPAPPARSQSSAASSPSAHPPSRSAPGDGPVPAPEPHAKAHA